MTLLTQVGWGQSTIASDGLNNSTTLFTLSGGAYYTGTTSATADAPSSAPYTVEGTHSRGIANGTATLTSSDINTSGYSSIQMSFRLASYSITSTGNGADAGDIVTVEVSPNGGLNYYSTVRVLGNSNARWSWSSGTGNATTSYDGNATPFSYQPAGGGARTTDGYSTVTITDIPATSNLRIRIALFNNDANERWLLDNFIVSGTPTPAIIGAATATAFTTTYGTASSAQDFSISGINLSADLVATAPTGFEVSNDGTTYGATATFAQTSGSASGSLRIRLNATATVSGSYNSQNIVLSSTGATSVNITTASSGNEVFKATPTISAPPSASAITLGQALSASTLSGGSASPSGGTFSFSSPSTVPGQTGTYSADITYTPSDVANYNTASTTTDVQVNAATTPSLIAGTISGSFGAVCINTTSSSQVFTLSGSNLDGTDVSVSSTSPAYTFSTTSGGSYSNPLTLTAYDGFSPGTIYVKYSPILTGADNADIEISGGGAPTVSVVQSGNSGVNTVPGVVANAATGISSTGATLSGTSSPGCTSVTTYGLEYSTTNDFTNGQGIAATTTGTSSNFSATLTGLSPNTTYYYKSLATNSGGTTYSAQSSFTTSVIGAPTATAATALGCSGFTANWGSVEGATEYRLDVSTSPTFDQVAYASDLIISEYVEGSSNNKYIEIYNGTGATVDLSNYQLMLFSNGEASATAVGATVQLSDSINHGQTIVYRNASATAFSGTATVNSAINFNGDDAIALYKISASAYVDIFGRIGEDPGTAWTSGATFTTLNKTLVRKTDVISGITSNPASGFPTLSTEWTQFDTDVASNLGSHTMTLGTTPSYISGYSNFLVSGTSQIITGLSPNTTYYYRVRAVSSNSTSANSNVITAVTYASFIPGTIASTNETICYGGDPASIGSSADASGGDGNITYKWQANGADIPSSNAATYDPPAGLTTTTTYTRYANDGTCNTTPTASSEEYTVTVNPYTWTGATNTVWAEGSNWSCGAPPPSGVPVKIETASNLPVLIGDVVVGNLTFNGGKITLGDYNLTVNGTITGQSSTSFVVTNGTGTLSRPINVAGIFEFPVGNATKYQPASINFYSTLSPTTLSARFISGDPGIVGTPPGGVVDVASYGYWSINSSNGNTDPYDATFTANSFNPLLPANAALMKAIKRSNNIGAWSICASNISGPQSSTLIEFTGLSGFSEFSIGLLAAEGPVLPVSLLSFSGYKDGVRNQLRWVTATETNNSGFQVERSSDGLNYQSIGFVGSLSIDGNSQTQLKYNFVDASPAGIKQYYRLKQLDIDGRSSLSNILLIQGEKPTSFEIASVFPNPSRGQVTMLLSAPANETVSIRVLDLAGRILETRQVNVLAGNNSIPFDLSKQAKGQYLIAVGEKVVRVVRD